MAESTSDEITFEALGEKIQEFADTMERLGSSLDTISKLMAKHTDLLDQGCAQAETLTGCAKKATDFIHEWKGEKNG